MSGPGMRSRKSSSNWGAHSPVGSICANPIRDTPGTPARIAVSKSSLAFRIFTHLAMLKILSRGYGDGLPEPHSHEQNRDTDVSDERRTPALGAFERIRWNGQGMNEAWWTSASSRPSRKGRKHHEKR